MSPDRDASLAVKYDGRVPRYTSYPTAPHFHAGITGETYRAWLGELPATPISLYLHVPFCRQLCHYCGCSTQAVKRRAPVDAWLDSLALEIDRVAEAIGRRAATGHVHWGGGTPNLLELEDFAAVHLRLASRFDLAGDAEISVELDPRLVDRRLVDGLAALGVTRASLGVQDFDPQVQQAIGRVQPYEATADAVAWLRAAGIDRLNFDLMYGLPHQTRDSVAATAARAAALGPDRLALFGYAHVPWMRPHQRLIDESALPGAAERLAQYRAAGQVLRDAGYVPIGLDHFARPEDPLALALASGRLRRNFQGYTTDACPVLIGLGPSAIGSPGHGFVQNASSVTAWRAALAGGGFAVHRGLALMDYDRLRGEVIERLMCQLSVDLAAVAAAHGEPITLFALERARLAELVADGLVRLDGWRVSVTELGRPFVRSVCALFDRYVATGAARHARAV